MTIFIVKANEMKNICNVGGILLVARKKKPAAFKDSIWEIFYCGSSSLAVMCLINFLPINIEIKLRIKFEWIKQVFCNVINELVHTQNLNFIAFLSFTRLRS